MAISNPRQNLIFDADMRAVDEHTQTATKREFDPVAGQEQPFQRQPAVARIRGIFPADGGWFPPILSDADRAQITAEWWVTDYTGRCRRHLLLTMKAAWKREPSPDDYALLEAMIAEARAAGELPYETTMTLYAFHEIKAKAHG